MSNKIKNNYFNELRFSVSPLFNHHFLSQSVVSRKKTWNLMGYL
ncbi:hypothetical protein KKH3_30810 [Pectobacterium actinidiae]|nr:hypothetical protein KKH3_30810 [Pectobacterium actinidiae]